MKSLEDIIKKCSYPRYEHQADNDDCRVVSMRYLMPEILKEFYILEKEGLKDKLMALINKKPLMWTQRAVNKLAQAIIKMMGGDK